MGDRCHVWEVYLIPADCDPAFSPLSKGDWEIRLTTMTRLIASPYHLPYNAALLDHARDLRRNMTVAERKLWYGFLRTFKYRVLRQRPIDNYIVDFYCAELKLVIEIDGDSHFTDEGKLYDEGRTRILEGYGLRVLRFTNDEVMSNFVAVCQAIEEIPPRLPSQGGVGGSSELP